MKKVISLLALTAVFAFTGCNKKKREDKPQMKAKHHMKKDHTRKDYVEKETRMKKKNCKSCNKSPRRVERQGY